MIELSSLKLEKIFLLLAVDSIDGGHRLLFISVI